MPNDRRQSLISLDSESSLPAQMTRRCCDRDSGTHYQAPPLSGPCQLATGLRWRSDHIVTQSWWRNCHKASECFQMSCGNALAPSLRGLIAPAPDQVIRVGVITIEVQGETMGAKEPLRLEGFIQRGAQKHPKLGSQYVCFVAGTHIRLREGTFGRNDRLDGPSRSQH